MLTLWQNWARCVDRGHELKLLDVTWCRWSKRARRERPNLRQCAPDFVLSDWAAISCPDRITRGESIVRRNVCRIDRNSSPEDTGIQHYHPLRYDPRVVCEELTREICRCWTVGPGRINVVIVGSGSKIVDEVTEKWKVRHGCAMDRDYDDSWIHDDDWIWWRSVDHDDNDDNVVVVKRRMLSKNPGDDDETIYTM